ncbi:MAG: cobalamin-binding protein [Leptolinea sp.]|nr:cobalamin-binding protein [Leptolinea sp.]
MKKRILLSLIVVLIMSACSPVVQPTAVQPVEQPSITPKPGETATMAPTAEMVMSDEEEISFVDDLDRDVVIKLPINRIVVLAPSLTETLFAIGAGELEVGRTEYCDYPEEVVNLPTIGGFSANTISVEAIIALEPDLVIGGSIHQAEVVDSLEKVGIPVFVSEPEDVKETLESIELIGKITGHTEQADDVVGQMRARMDEIAEFVTAIPEEERPTVFYEVWHEPLMSASNSAFVGELIGMAGGVNIFGELEEEYPTISAEQLIELDPQFIIGPSSHGDQMTAEVIGSREGWKNLTAVKNEAIYIVDGNIVSRSSPRIVDALNFFVDTLHPEFKK